MVMQRLSMISLCLGGAVLVESAQAQSKSEPRYTLDATGTRVIALSNLPGGEGCASATGTGRVVKRHFEKGALRAITFKTVKSGESYINLPYPNEIGNAQTRAKVQEGFASLLVEGQDLVLGIKVCGAAGRIEELSSVALRNPKAEPAAASPKAEPAATSPTAETAAAPAAGTTPPSTGISPAQPVAATPVVATSAKPSKWRVRQLSKVQQDISIASNDRAFSFSLSCMKSAKGRTGYSTFLSIPRDWIPFDIASVISLDGNATGWKLSPADDGFVLSDTTEDNMVTLSAAARGALAKGEKLAIAGRTERGRARSAAFDISGGDAAFASFTAKCETLPRP